MYKTFTFLASYVVVLTLVGSVATGGVVFLDDFEDGSATDGAPVTWSPMPGWTGSFEVVDGDYVLTRPRDSEEMYSTVNQNALGDTSVRTQGRLNGPSASWFGLFARVNLTPQTACPFTSSCQRSRDGAASCWKWALRASQKNAKTRRLCWRQVAIIVQTRSHQRCPRLPRVPCVM